ncbi:MAG TPA: hypothetical protein VGM30_10315 [Puia sp.]|jgi:hypothetical protein
MSTNDDETFGIQYTDDQLFTICLNIAEKLQAFYITDSKSKYPEGMSLEEFVRKGIKDEL